MAFILKLDATKNCFNYGIVICGIKLTELTSFYFHYTFFKFNLCFRECFLGLVTTLIYVFVT